MTRFSLLAFVQHMGQFLAQNLKFLFWNPDSTLNSLMLMSYLAQYLMDAQ